MKGYQSLLVQPSTSPHVGTVPFGVNRVVSFLTEPNAYIHLQHTLCPGVFTGHLNRIPQDGAHYPKELNYKPQGFSSSRHSFWPPSALHTCFSCPLSIPEGQIQL